MKKFVNCCFVKWIEKIIEKKNGVIERITVWVASEGD